MSLFSLESQVCFVCFPFSVFPWTGCVLLSPHRLCLSPSPALAQDIARIDELWCEGLRRFGGPFLAGAGFTGVDAFFTPVAFRVRGYDLKLSAPARDYAARLLALPAMQEWHTAALAETWREPGHEAELLAAGEIIEDLRAR